MATDELPEGRAEQIYAVVFGLFPGDSEYYTIVERDTETGGAPTGAEAVVAWLQPGVKHYVERRPVDEDFFYYRFRHGGFGTTPGTPTAWYRARAVPWNGEIPLPPREALLDFDLVLDPADGTVDIEVNGSRRVASVKWEWATDDYPTTATTAANTDTEGDVTILDAFTLFVGQTGYVRVEFYDQASGGGNLLGTLRNSVTYPAGSDTPQLGTGVILNPEFDFDAPLNGSYWAVDTSSTGAAVIADSPTVGLGIDFPFDGDTQVTTLVQVTDPDDDPNKSITV